MTAITEKFVERHRGEILEMVVRRSPYSIKTLAKKLGVSRTTLYNKFKEYNVDYDFLLLASSVLHYDFKSEIPELNNKIGLPMPYNHKGSIADKQYVDLLERYKRLFGFLTKIIHKHGLEPMKKQVDRIVGKKNA